MLNKSIAEVRSYCFEINSVYQLILPYIRIVCLCLSQILAVPSVRLRAKCDPSHVIHVENIPWTATKKEIVDLFGNIEILNGVNGIHFIVDNEKIHNNAFIELASLKDYQLAMDRKVLQWHYFTVISKYSLFCANSYTIVAQCVFLILS